MTRHAVTAAAIMLGSAAGAGSIEAQFPRDPAQHQQAPRVAPPAWLAENQEIIRLTTPKRTLSIGIQFPHALQLFSLNPFSAVVTLAGMSTPGLSIVRPPDFAHFVTDPDVGLSPETAAALMRQARHLLLDPAANDTVPTSVIESVRAAGIAFDVPQPAQLRRARRLIGPALFFGRFFSAKRNRPFAVVAVINLRDREGRERAGTGLRVTDDVVFFDITPYIASTDTTNPSSLRLYWSGRTREITRRYAIEMGHVRWDQLPQPTRDAFAQTFWPGGVPPAAREVAAPAALQSPQHDFAESFAVAVLYPHTFETEPVFAFDPFRPWTNAPEPEPILERLRFIDALLEPDDAAASDHIRRIEDEVRSSQPTDDPNSQDPSR